jgi:hypothetical protein
MPDCASLNFIRERAWNRATHAPLARTDLSRQGMQAECAGEFWAAPKFSTNYVDNSVSMWVLTPPSHRAQREYGSGLKNDHLIKPFKINELQNSCNRQGKSSLNCHG